VLFVAVPLLRTTGVDEWKEASAEQLRRIELRERRDKRLPWRSASSSSTTTPASSTTPTTRRRRAELRAEALAALAALEEDEQRAGGARGVPAPPGNPASEAVAGQSDGDSG